MSARLIRFDWAIKNILRNKENFDILEGFLSEILKKDITIIEMLESESNKETREQKLNRVDILAKDENETVIILEIQVSKEYDYYLRMLFGVSRAISERMYEGKAYKNVKKVYSINIVYFDLGHGDDYVYHGKTNFVGIHKKDILQLEKKQKELYNVQKIEEVFPEYYILKVNKFDDEIKDNIDEWLYFLKNETVKEGSKAKGLKAAADKLNILKMDKKEKIIYREYLDELQYETSMIESSFSAGKIEGKEEGKKEGELNKAIEIAKKLIKNKVEIDIIIQATGLTKKEIEKLL